MIHCILSSRLSAYLDGELPPRRRRAVERHLTGCTTCAERLEGLRRAQASVRAAPPSAPPAEAWARLRERMAEPAQAPAPVPARRRAAAWGAAAAAVLLAAAASLYVALGPAPAPAPGGPSFVTTADLVDDEPVALSPSIELLLVARTNGGPEGDDR